MLIPKHRNSDVIEKANLKVTSLYELAIKAEINDPRMFVRKFINHDRSVRKR